MPTTVATFDDFVLAYGDVLLRTARLITLDDSDAEDLVQECLLQIARRWNRVSAMEQQVAYARRVLVNLALRGSKKRSRQRAELDPHPIDGATGADAAELLGLRDELMIGLRQLTPRQRTVLALRYFYDLPESQVADALGCSIGTVRSTTSRSLAQLRDAIQRPPQTTRCER